MSEARATEIVLRVCSVLDQLSIRYMLVGSFSSNFYGRPRLTHDADFVLQTDTLPAAALRAALGEEYHLDPQKSFETVTATMRWIVMHKASVFKIELFELSDDPHDQSRFARRQEVDVEGHDVMLPTAEDVVVTKLRWSKSGGRQKDVEDVQKVLSVQKGKLDLAYIRGWCDQHGTRELFERLLSSAEAL